MPAIPALRPLRHRDFRLLWTGLAISLIGDGLWVISIAWQVIELDGGPAELSLVATAWSAGLIAFVLVGGIVADRVARRAVMLAADVVRAAVVLAAAGLSLSGMLEIWQLAVAGFIVGACDSFFIPAYTAVIPRLLPDDQLLAANGLEGMVRPLAAWAIGPALGGVLIAVFSPGAAILTAGLTWIFSACCLLLIRTNTAPDRSEQEKDSSALTDLRVGWAYVKRTPWLWATLLFACIAVLSSAGPIEVLAPFAVEDRAGSDSAGYGLLMAGFGIGSVVGALVISSRPMPRRYLTTMLVGWSVGGLPIALLGVVNALWIMCIAAFTIGVGSAIGNVIWGTLLQRRVPDGIRGRVSSLDFFVSLGLMPVSMALAGPAGDAFGLTSVFIVAAVVPVAAALFAFVVGRLGDDEVEHLLS